VYAADTAASSQGKRSPPSVSRGDIIVELAAPIHDSGARRLADTKRVTFQREL
jgi:hypothetical protein